VAVFFSTKMSLLRSLVCGCLFFYKDAAPTELNPQLKNMRIDVPTRIDILKTQP